MRRRPLRDELRDVFDDLSEPAHPALSARIRERMAAPPPSPRTPRLAVAVALVTAAVLVGSLVFFSRHAAAPRTSPAGGPGPTVGTVSPAAPTPAPTAVAGGPGGTGATPSPGATLAGFTCAAQSGGGAANAAAPVGVTAVRVGAQSGFDRFVIELDGPVPHFDVAPQAGATFTQDASGARVTLRGSAGLLVTLRGARSAGTYTGPADLRPAGTPALLEAGQVGDFEGVVHWGLGLSHAACFHAYTLTGPSRLVVDVQT